MNDTTPDGLNESKQQAIAKLSSLIKDIKVAMLTTQDKAGELRSRPMVTQSSPIENDLWFFTGKSTTKAQELQSHHQLNPAYSKPEDNCYVSISGVGEVVDDRSKMKELWNPLYRAWFPAGLDDPELRLLRVKITQAEYWDSVSNKLVQLFGFAKAALTGKPHSGEGTDHQKIKIA